MSRRPPLVQREPAAAARSRRRGDRGRLDRDRDLRAAARAVRPARAEFTPCAGAVARTTCSAPTSSAATSSAASSTARASRFRSRSCSSCSRPRSAARRRDRRLLPRARRRHADARRRPVFAFPPIILAMVVAAVLGRGLQNAALAIVVVAWPSYARVVRGLVLSVGDSEYVQSARLLGAPARRALVRDVLPNVAGPVLVLATLDLANAILLLSGLSFLGLGAQPPTAEWGSMVADGTQYFQWWWMGTFPGLAIFTVVLAFNFLGDSLRDVFDPRTAWRSAGERSEPARGRRPAGAARRRATGSSRSSTASTTASSRARCSASRARAAAARRCRCWRCSGCCPRAPSSRAARASASRDLLRLPRRQLRDDRGARARDGLPGPAHLAAPDALDRPPADRARAAPPRPRPARRRAARARAARRTCGSRIRQAALRAFPHQFSGGMRQRIAIAIALACRPKLLIADEPTTALDVTVQAGILRLLDRLRRENDLAVVLITHDLGVMSAIADRVSIFYAGRVVESGTREDGPAPRRATRTRARCSTRCRIRRRPQDSRSSRSPARRRARARSRPAAPSTRAAATRRRAASTRCRRSSRAGGRLLACPVDPFAAR